MKLQEDPRDTRGICWTSDCDKPQSSEHVGYWCEEHYLARRVRIQEEMERIANDSQGNPRMQEPERPAHELATEGNAYGWWWSCSCGKRGAASARTQGLASAAAARHLRATQKAAA